MRRRPGICRLRQIHRMLKAFLITLTCFIVLGCSPQVGAQDEPQDSEIILRLTAREVLLDVFAFDTRSRPVVDLGIGDFEVFESPRHKQKMAGVVTSLHFYDPNGHEFSETAGTGFLRAEAVRCLDRVTAHYILAYRPSDQGWTSGFHEVLVETRRHGVKLSYRHKYFVGQKEPLPHMEQIAAGKLHEDLRRAACGHSNVPPSISLRAEPVGTGRTDVLRYVVRIEPNSLAFVSMLDSGRRVQLDYGACNFDAMGRELKFLEGTTDQVLSRVDYARVQEHGLQTLFEVPALKELAMIRFVIRDRATGNIGVVNAMVPAIENASHARAVEDFPLSGMSHSRVINNPARDAIGSFGSVVPNPHGFCADVYELRDYGGLPDFRELDPVGTLYSDYLLIPNQQSPRPCSLPGVTCDSSFGVDYHGEFWVRTPGEYQFELTSDDGAMLQIDDSQVIKVDGRHPAIRGTGNVFLTAGRHAMHLPYFEDGRGLIMLELWVRPPGGEWRVFNMRDFAPPSGESPTNSQITHN
jgi:hypothetical protein